MHLVGLAHILYVNMHDVMNCIALMKLNGIELMLMHGSVLGVISLDGRYCDVSNPVAKKKKYK